MSPAPGMALARSLGHTIPARAGGLLGHLVLPLERLQWGFSSGYHTAPWEWPWAWVGLQGPAVVWLRDMPSGHWALQPTSWEGRNVAVRACGLSWEGMEPVGLSLMRYVLPPSQAPYFNCIFLHEGWPLCLHEKVVVHLAPLNPLLLRPGDFYLQAEPGEELSARITLKHLSLDLRTVEETPVPEAAYALLFTNEWLEEINSNQAQVPLHTCLVATENGVAPLPWSSITTPEFIDKPKTAADGASAGAQHSPAPETTAELAAPSVPVSRSTSGIPVPYGNIVSTIPGCKGTPRKSRQGRYPGLIKVEQAGLRKQPAVLAMPSLCHILSQNLEGEYVDLLEPSREQPDLLTWSLPPAGPAGPMGAEVTLPWANGEPGADASLCGGAEEGPCTPCLGWTLSREPGPRSPRCRHRDSYLAALQNPLSLSTGLMSAILEEPDGPGPEPPPTTPNDTPAQPGPGSSSPTLLARRPHRASSRVQTRARPSSPQLPPAPAGSSHKFSFLKGPRFGAAPGDDRAASQHEGAWKKISAIYSPRMGRAKPTGKGDVQVGLRCLPRLGGGAFAFLCLVAHWQLLSPLSLPAGMNGTALESSGCKSSAPAPSTGTPGREPPAWQDLHTGLLRSGIVTLPGTAGPRGAWGGLWRDSAMLL